MPEPLFKVVKINRLPTGSRLKAFIDIKFNEMILIKGLRVIDGKTGLFVSMPQEQGYDRRWYDLVRCLKPETAEEITKVVLEAYEKECKYETGDGENNEPWKITDKPESDRVCS